MNTDAAMADENLMAKELLSIVSPYGYNKQVPYILSRDAVDEAGFNSRSISTQYWIDKQKSYTNRYRNSNFLFELFGQFSSEDGNDVHASVVSFTDPHNKWDPPENNGPPPPLTLGPEVQLCSCSP